ncbi:hypothetical protein ACIKK6_02930, partial [Bacillus thuringiensis]
KFSIQQQKKVSTLLLIPGNFDLDHLKKIHKHIFEDIYEFAGKIRQENIASNISISNSRYSSKRRYLPTYCAAYTKREK